GSPRTSGRRRIMTAATEQTTIPTALGDLRAGVWVPDLPGPLPGLVLVDGSGDGAFDDFGEWPGLLASCGAVVLAHDKPGCGGSARGPTVDGAVGLLGVSQGGWVAVRAASLDPAVDFVISVSGPGVTPAAQERT